MKSSHIAIADIDVDFGGTRAEDAVLRRLSVEIVLRHGGGACGRTMPENEVCRALARQARFLLRYCRFPKLESAATALATLLLAAPAPGEARTPIESLRLRLTECGPAAHDDGLELDLERAANGDTLEIETKPFGFVEIIHVTDLAGIYRLAVAPRASIPLHIHRVMHEAEMVLSPALLVNGRRVPPGAVHRWPLRAAHRYDNPSEAWQTILCLDCPRFLPEDEIATDGEPADVRPEELPAGEEGLSS